MRHETDPSVTEDFEHDPRYAISLKETWICVAYWAAFTAVMVGVAWAIAGNRDPAETTYIMGFPDWFFWTGIVTVGVFSIIPFFIVKFLFTEVDLEPRPAERVATHDTGKAER